MEIRSKIFIKSYLNLLICIHQPLRLDSSMSFMNIIKLQVNWVLLLAMNMPSLRIREYITVADCRYKICMQTTSYLISNPDN